MERAIGSRINIKALEHMLAIQYYDCVADIIDSEQVQKLAVHSQHLGTSRLQHSFNVSYYSFLVCRFFGWDYRSAARAGLLHDLFYYDWRRKRTPGRSNHATWHPRVALDNARKLCDLNEIEADAIVKHMWPCTLRPPKYKESFVVTFADKLCAMFEVLDGEAIKTLNFFKVGHGTKP